MYKVVAGDCRDILNGITIVHAVPYHRVDHLEIGDNSIDAMVCDPPYGLSFMSRGWDHSVPGPDYWTAAYRVLKPGGYLVAFGGTRTHHRLMCAIEDSGFEIRDCLMWLYGSGFPKSHNVALGIDKKYGLENRGRAIPTASSYQACDTERENKLISNPVEKYRARTEAAEPWDGWGTALKPAWEPIILARKPFPGSVADNVLEHGTGALNIDACRIPTESDLGRRNNEKATWGTYGNGPSKYAGVPVDEQGRWPANLILDEESAELLDEQSGDLQSGYMEVNQRGKRGIVYNFKGPPSDNVNVGGGCINVTYGDRGGASRFFYVAKASREEREAGLSGPRQTVSDGRKKAADNAYQRGKTERLNLHPTVKPISLMRWVCRLVTPPGGTVLDPFCGSGSTVAAAVIEGFDAIGIDIDPVSVDIADKRAAYATVEAGTATVKEAVKLAGPVQLGMFGEKTK